MEKLSRYLLFVPLLFSVILSSGVFFLPLGLLFAGSLKIGAKLAGLCLLMGPGLFLINWFFYRRKWFRTSITVSLFWPLFIILNLFLKIQTGHGLVGLREQERLQNTLLSPTAHRYQANETLAAEIREGKIFFLITHDNDGSFSRSRIGVIQEGILKVDPGRVVSQVERENIKLVLQTGRNSHGELLSVIIKDARLQN